MVCRFDLIHIRSSIQSKRKCNYCGWSNTFCYGMQHHRRHVSFGVNSFGKFVAINFKVELSLIRLHPINTTKLDIWLRSRGSYYTVRKLNIIFSLNFVVMLRYIVDYFIKKCYVAVLSEFFSSTWNIYGRIWYRQSCSHGKSTILCSRQIKREKYESKSEKWCSRKV